MSKSPRPRMLLLSADERAEVNHRILAAPTRIGGPKWSELAEHLLDYVRDHDAQDLADLVYDPPTDAKA